MTSGEDFLRRCRKGKKQNDHDYREHVRRAFFSSLPSFPEELLWDLYEDTVQSVSEGDANRELEEVIAEEIDLLSGEYDPAASILGDRELTLVYEAVNEYAADLPDDLIFTVMQVAVERGLLG